MYRAHLQPNERRDKGQLEWSTKRRNHPWIRYSRWFRRCRPLPREYCLSSSTSWTESYSLQPADTLLSQINKGHGPKGPMVSRLITLGKEAGFRGLFAGLGPRMSEYDVKLRGTLLIIGASHDCRIGFVPVLDVLRHQERLGRSSRNRDPQRGLGGSPDGRGSRGELHCTTKANGGGVEVLL